MDPLNLIKIIAAIVTVIVAFIAGVIELRLNPDNWLNRWFALFFASASLGFLTYTIYHFIYMDSYSNASRIIIPIMITAQILFNFIPVSLVMTVFIVEKYKKVALSLKYLGTMIALFIVMSLGYFIWIPKLDNEAYALGNINTETEPGLQIFVNFLRIVLLCYAVLKYAMITKKVEEETKKRVQWFFTGIIIAIIGLFINITGGLFGFIIFEIIALIFVDIGIIIVVKGFLI